jgi:hypothetical protein
MMKRVIIVSFAFICAHLHFAMCQDDLQRIEDASLQTENPKISMLSMLSKIIELNVTDEVVKGSLTESYSGVWLNATQKPKSTPTSVNGLCEIEETYEEEETIIDRIPYEVEVEVWCWSIRCTEMETRYREEKRTQNVTKTRLVDAISDQNHSLSSQYL